jgi:hypothetical protein
MGHSSSATTNPVLYRARGRGYITSRASADDEAAQGERAELGAPRFGMKRSTSRENAAQ